MTGARFQCPKCGTVVESKISGVLCTGQRSGWSHAATRMALVDEHLSGTQESSVKQQPPIDTAIWVKDQLARHDKTLNDKVFELGELTRRVEALEKPGPQGSPSNWESKLAELEERLGAEGVYKPDRPILRRLEALESLTGKVGHDRMDRFEQKLADLEKRLVEANDHRRSYMGRVNSLIVEVHKQHRPAIANLEESISELRDAVDKAVGAANQALSERAGAWAEGNAWKQKQLDALEQRLVKRMDEVQQRALNTSSHLSQHLQAPHPHKDQQ